MNLKSKLGNGQFVILAEMEPPKGVDVSQMTSNALRVIDKVDAFVIPDMNNAILRMSALGGAIILQGKGLETVLQINCRDRNRLALQADLLAAYACGITNIMTAQGDDPSSGDHHQAKTVNDIDLSELLDVVHELQEGRDMAGSELTGSPSFVVGSTVLEWEAPELQAEVERGAQFLVTPPLFDLAAIEPFLNQAGLSKAKIFPTVLLLKSVGMARYIDLHQDNIHIPKEIISRLQNASDTTNESMQCAAEMVKTAREGGYGGVLLSTLGWENRLPEILEMI